ncbi:MAG: hypothetical protein ABSA91_07775 [Acidimicrobiales bacterium]
MGTWSQLHPEGRHIYYEGTDPDGFAEQIKAEFDFDPRNDPQWGVHDSFGFHCPGEHLDAIYGGGFDRYPVVTASVLGRRSA